MNSNNNNTTNNAPQQPTQADIQRQSIQRDMDKQSQRDANSSGVSNVIGQHNYSYDAQLPNQKGLAAKLHRKLLPFLKWWKRVHYRLEESARKRKRIIVLGFVGVALFSFAYGHHDKLGIAVANTQVGTSRTFINEDEMKMTSEKYDTRNQSLQANFVTSSPSGNISPKNLSANFVFANLPPKDGLKRPTMNLIPTFNNHYTVIIHHVYPGFGGVEISFHNNSKMSVGTLSSSASDSGGSEYLSQSENKELDNIAKNGADTEHTSKMYHLLDKLQKHNLSNFVIGERNILKSHRGFIDPTATPRDLALHGLERHLSHDNSDIKGDQTLIKNEKAQIKDDQGKIRQIDRGADTGDKKTEIQHTAEEVQHLGDTIKNYNDHIHEIKTDVRLTLSRIQRVKENISVLPKTKSPRPIGAFTNSAH